MQTIPVYPKELARKGVTGEAEVEFFLSPKGEVVLPRVNRASEPEFGRAALEAVGKWKYLEEPGKSASWRRLAVPIGFSQVPEEIVDFVPWFNLDQLPVPEEITAVSPPLGWPAGGEALACLTYEIDAEGRVHDVIVEAITDEGWRRPLVDATKNWRYRPGIKLDRNVPTKVTTFCWLPSGRFSTEGGIPEAELKAKKTTSCRSSSRSRCPRSRTNGSTVWVCVR